MKSYSITKFGIIIFATILFGAGCVVSSGPGHLGDGKDFRARNNIRGTIRVKLVDTSERAIVNTKVIIKSENGIRCIKEPCNTEYEEWTRSSNSEGSVSISADMINVFTTIAVEGYPEKDLNKDAQKITDHDWSIKLDSSAITHP